MLASCTAARREVQRHGRGPVNVILLIGDGMGDAELTAARNYLVGGSGRLKMEQLPVHGRLSTFAVVENNPRLPDYVIDSAASATAWSTGHKTSVGRLSTAPQSGEPLPTLVELSRAAHVPVAIVTTSEVTDATPAALLAHVNQRLCQGPADMKLCPEFRRENGGPGSIAEQILDQRAEVVLGGGRQRFEQRVGNGEKESTLLEQARTRGFTLLTHSDELAQPLTPPILGLFAHGDLDRLWRGDPAKLHPGSGPQRCTAAGRQPGQPTLEAMTRKALEVVERLAAERRRPFFIQVEGANIDKSAHAADPCGQIGETAELDRTVELVLAYAQEHGNTLVIVTADHSHATQIVPHPLAGAHYPGLLSTLITNEGALLTLGYATNAPGGSQTHTGTDVPLFAFGPFSERLQGPHDQSELFGVVSAALGLQAEP
ncbi:MAG: alkaline phosphatase [Candidatus Binatia bacterium]|nr:alkaline phosphatase [Candidatus Binatia bacterium]